jgi:uracil-DNA glycosylase
MTSLPDRISTCRLCADRFAATDTAHEPRPVVWFGSGARILIASQAPGARAHAAGVPFHDASGTRLREWLGMDGATFYDRGRVAIIPMAFCFPGYRKGSDLPPPPECARAWRAEALSFAGRFDLTILIGGHAQKYHLGPAAAGGVTRTVAAWRDHAPAVFPLPHPSWRNTAWLKRNPWFEAELLPVLRMRVQEALK